MDHAQLNAMRPITIDNVLHSARILGDDCQELRQFCIEGIELDRARIDELVGRSLMPVTALSSVIGYDAASASVHRADHEGTTLRDAALASGSISADDFDRVVDPRRMVGTP